MSPIISTVVPMAYHLLSRRQDAASSDQSRASSTSQMTNSDPSSSTRAHIYVGLGLALGTVLIIAVLTVIGFSRRYKRRANIKDLESNHTSPLQDLHCFRRPGAAKPHIYLVPGHHEEMTAVSGSNNHAFTYPYSARSQQLDRSATTASKQSKHQSRPSGILRRFSAFLDSTVEEPVHPIHRHETEARVLGTLRFPQFDQGSSIAGETVGTPDSYTTYMTPAVLDPHHAEQSWKTPRQGSKRGKLGTNALFRFMPETAVFGSIPKLGRDVSCPRSVKNDAPPRLPPLGAVSPLRIPQPRRDTNPKARSIKRLSTGPLLRASRRSIFGSREFHRAVQHDRHASLKSVPSGRWQSPQRSGVESRSKGARLTTGRSRQSTRSTVRRSTGDGISRRSTSANSTSTNDSRFSRLSTHQIETANRVSIKRVNSFGPVRGAVRGVKKITTPMSRLYLKTSVSANGSPISRKRTSFGKRLSVIRDTTPEKSASAAFTQQSASDSNETPSTPPRQASPVRYYSDAARDARSTREPTALSSKQTSSSIYYQRSFHSGAAHYSRDPSPATPTRPVSYHNRQIIHNNSDDDIFGYDHRTSPKSRSTSRGRKHYRQRSGSTVSPLTPDMLGQLGSSPVQFSDPRILHGIQEEAESDEEGAAPRLPVAKMPVHPIKTEHRLEPSRAAWRLSSPTIPTNLTTSRLDIVRNGSTASRQSQRSSTSHLSIPLFPSTPSNRLQQLSSAAKPVPAVTNSQSSAPSSASQRKSYAGFSSPLPFSPTTNTSPSTYLPSSPPVPAARKPALYDPMTAPQALQIKNSKNTAHHDPLSPPIAVGTSQQSATIFKSKGGPDPDQSCYEHFPIDVDSGVKSDKAGTPTQYKRRQVSSVAKFAAAGGSAAADMDAMRDRINSTLARFGNLKDNLPIGEGVEEPMHDYGLEDDDIWKAPKLPDLHFDPVPLFSSATDSLGKKASRKTRKGTK